MQVVVNAAMSVDGKLAARTREQLLISGEADLDRVDTLRATSDAVMVGIGTVVADDPSLTIDDPDRVATREAAGKPAHPARIVADSHAQTPLDARVLDGVATTYIAVSEAADSGRIATLEDAGATVLELGSTRVDIGAVVDYLESIEMEQLLIEGGGELIFSAFAGGHVDTLKLFIGSLIIGGGDAPTLADGDGFVDDFPRLELQRVARLDDGIFISYHIDDGTE